MSDELKAAQERGAQIKQLATLVEVSGLGDIVKQLSVIAEQNRQAHAEQIDKLTTAIETLVETVSEKQIEGTDLSGLIEAVASLKQEAAIPHQPHNWEIGFERDQRGFMKSGVTLTPLPRVIN